MLNFTSRKSISHTTLCDIKIIYSISKRKKCKRKLRIAYKWKHLKRFKKNLVSSFVIQYFLKLFFPLKKSCLKPKNNITWNVQYVHCTHTHTHTHTHTQIFFFHISAYFIIVIVYLYILRRVVKQHNLST